MSIQNSPFYMIRHGQSQANKDKIFAGHSDTPLTDLGAQQAIDARQVVEALEHKPDVIYHSHILRARVTAEILNQNLELPMIEEHGFAEIDIGDWEGDSYANDYGRWSSLFTQGVKPNNGESFIEFSKRVTVAKNKALTAGHKLPMIVCHGGVFRSMAKVYGLDSAPTANSVLHYFEPNLDNANFPWDVYAITLANGVIQQEKIAFLLNPDVTAEKPLRY